VDCFSWVNETGSCDSQTMLHTNDSLLVRSTHSFGSHFPEPHTRGNQGKQAARLFIDFLESAGAYFAGTGMRCPWPLFFVTKSSSLACLFAISSLMSERVLVSLTLLRR
jgi:hypothetical protein